MDRKQFITRSLQAMAGAAISGPAIIQAAACTPARGTMKPMAEPFSFAQTPLPYPYAALVPHIDALTMEIHYSKHHAAYVKNVNEALVAEGIGATDEASFFSGVSKLSAKARNNGGGAWNHNFFWQLMAPARGGAPSGMIGDAISGAFGSFEKFKELFTDAAMKRFGSGWAWLVLNDGKLHIGSTPNQDNPLMDVSELRGKPLLAIDVWEHAYYLNYQNKRNEYVAAWWNLVNWDAVASRLG
ncbi:MAG: superoxide dismutase [Flavobacteriales bacterium]|nr:superoxide dismutase [Flavobacteriales bacterium]